MKRFTVEEIHSYFQQLGKLHSTDQKQATEPVRSFLWGLASAFRFCASIVHDHLIVKESDPAAPRAVPPAD